MKTGTGTNKVKKATLSPDDTLKKFFARHPSRADIFTESVNRVMTRLALKHNALNLAQGFPNFPCPAELKEAACRAINVDYNQ